MNKKIYFNNKFLDFFIGDAQPSNNQQIKVYLKIDTNDLKEIEKLFLDEKETTKIKINTIYFDKVLNYLKKQCSYIEAAGGFIKKDNEFLFIYRLDKWDLPKGKLDKAETEEHAAIRECEEECGIKNLTITKQLNSTFHIYPYKKNFALKQTFWYLITSDYTGLLTPQTNENITEVKWFNQNEINNIALQNTYLPIKDVINEGLTLT